MSVIDELDCGTYRGLTLAVQIHEQPHGLMYVANARDEYRKPLYKSQQPHDSAQSALIALKSQIDKAMDAHEREQDNSEANGFNIHQTDPRRLKREILAAIKKARR